MLTRVDVQSENPFYLEIRDARPTDSIIVKKIEGLGPPDIDIFMGDYARDGGYYSGRRVLPRDVIVTLDYNPNYATGETVSGLRQLLYKTFMDPFGVSKNVILILHDDELVDSYLTGYTSKFDGDIFSDDTTAQITLRCPNPYLMDRNVTVVPAEGPTVPFDYSGNAEAGIIVDALVTAPSAYLTFKLNSTDLLVLNYNFQVGDYVFLDTRQGERTIQVSRDVNNVTTTTDILYAKTGTSVWPTVRTSDNVLKAYGLTANQVVASILSISYQATYWGI